MANPRKEHVDFQQLIERSEKARETLAEARVKLRNQFDIVGRMQEMATSDPAKIVGGSLVGGYLLKKIFFRKKSPVQRGRREREVGHLKKERGLLLGIIALIGALAKPAIKVYATKLLRDYLKRRLYVGPSHRPASRSLPRY